MAEGVSHPLMKKLGLLLISTMTIKNYGRTIGIPMIVPKGNDRTWSRAMWKYLQRMDRCTRRVMAEKMDKCFQDMIIFGSAQYEITQADSNAIADLMEGKKP